MSPKGSITLCIGRWRNDPSPSNSLPNGRPANRPDKSRIVVPEFPQLMASIGARSPSQPLPLTRSASPSRKISTPIWRNALTVRELSSPSDRLNIRLPPFAMLARMTARWAMDLSPGTEISPRRGCLIGSTRFMQNSQAICSLTSLACAKSCSSDEPLPLSIQRFIFSRLRM
jgi:hypothetical protein